MGVKIEYIYIINFRIYDRGMYTGKTNSEKEAREQNKSRAIKLKNETRYGVFAKNRLA